MKIMKMNILYCILYNYVAYIYNLSHTMFNRDIRAEGVDYMYNQHV